MHPMIKPALRRAWRDRQTLQYGVAPAHAVALGPVDTATGSFLDLLDGTRNVDQLREAAAALGLGEAAVDRLLERLAGAGLLDDATADRAAAAEVTEQLRPDLASLTVTSPAPGGGLRRLTARRSAHVRVQGAGRVGATLASLLAAAGVGYVDVRDGGRVEPWDTAPGGIPAAERGQRREAAGRRAVRQASPWASRQPPASSRDGLDLVVLAPRDGLAAYAPDPAVAEPLLRTGTPHLYAGVVEGTGVVGPLVLPGATPCADCLMRQWAQREPTWPLLVAQWRSARRTGVPACDVALATLVASVAASHVLGFLDSGATVAAGARLRYVLPDVTGEREPVTAHPECPCGAAAPVAEAAGGPPEGEAASGESRSAPDLAAVE
mgnify:CR=1 FL=1